MRFLPHRPALVFICAFFCFAAARAGEVTVVRVWPGYRSAESFERISEYFDGKENSGGETVLRTRPAQRAGFYFLVRLNNTGGPVAGATFELSVISPASATPHPFKFTANLPAGGHVFECGLTGNDWPNAKAHPVAWKLVVRTPDGAELASTQSFLWSKPADPQARE
ncbi:MAG: hypothetical protein ABSE59_01265 [Opitutaceae bacterium]